jgi:hypothetical protein
MSNFNLEANQLFWATGRRLAASFIAANESLLLPHAFHSFTHAEIGILKGILIKT